MNPDKKPYIVRFTDDFGTIHAIAFQRKDIDQTSDELGAGTRSNLLTKLLREIGFEDAHRYLPETNKGGAKR